MKTVIVSAFPACGKSWVFENQDKLSLKVADSDSSKFSWVLDEEGLSTGARNQDFPTNYIEHIKSLVGEVDYILVSSHQEVRDALNEAQLPYVLVMPHRNLMHEWIGRCWLKGIITLSPKLMEVVLHVHGYGCLLWMKRSLRVRLISY